MHRLVIVISIAFVLSALLVAAGWSRRPGRDVESTTLDTLWDAPDFRYVDQDGHVVTRAELSGDVWVANFIFTECRTVCPLLTARMVDLQRRLAGEKVRFVSFSVDPAHDTPAVLRAYADRWAPAEPRWTLLATDEATLPRLASGFKVTAEKTGDPRDPILHTGLFMLVDARGRVRGAFDTEHPSMLEELARGVRALTGGAGGEAMALPTSGDGLYHALSCANCHERADLAPPLADLSGRRRELADGRVVIADEAWVRSSILEPDAARVKGYPLRMPGYAGVLDEARLATLVAWVLARHADAPIDAGEVAVEEDPVCHMQVRVGPDAISAESGGRTVHFCSEHCRTVFLHSLPSSLPSAMPGSASSTEKAK